MTERKINIDDIKDTEWLIVLKELIDSGVSKEEFKKFLEEMRKQKGLSK